MNSSEHRRLMDEIGIWQREGLITVDQAGKIMARYPEPPPQKWPLLITSIFGSLLVGLGIILLLAYNWSDLTRPMRAVIAYIPLLGALGLCAWIVFAGKTGTALREGTGAFLALAVGASIALVAQTYQLGGTFRDFTLAWMLLILPSIYVLDAVMPALIYLFGITGWAIGQRCYDDNPYGFWLLLAGVVPYLVWVRLRDRESVKGCWLLWGMTIGVLAGVATVMGRHEPMLWFSLYASLFAACLMADELWGARHLTLWGRPLTLVGGGGLGVMVFLYSFIDFWDDMERHYSYYWNPAAKTPDLLLAGIALLLAVILLVIGFRRFTGPALRMAACFPLVAGRADGLEHVGERPCADSRHPDERLRLPAGRPDRGPGGPGDEAGDDEPGAPAAGGPVAGPFLRCRHEHPGARHCLHCAGAGFLVANGLMIRRRRVS